MSSPMSVGAPSVLPPPRPTPEAVFDIMHRHNPTIFYAVPSLFAALLAHPQMSSGAGSRRLRLCVSAGGALPAQIARRWGNTGGGANPAALRPAPGVGPRLLHTP